MNQKSIEELVEIGCAAADKAMADMPDDMCCSDVLKSGNIAFVNAVFNTLMDGDAFTWIEITDAMERADRKYGPVANTYETLGALRLEMGEVMEAMQQRRNHRVAEELMDVAIVALRGIKAIKNRRSKNES